MQKRSVSLFVIPLLIVSLFSTLALAKPKQAKHKGRWKNSNSVAHDRSFLEKTFKVDSRKIDYLANLNLSTEEMSLIFYLSSISKRTIASNELDFIIHNIDNWAKLTWYFGLPPIIMENGIRTYRHPVHEKIMAKGKTKRKNRFNQDDYEYEYKRFGIKEKLEIKDDKYEYKYQNKRLGIEEKLEVKFPSYRYEYSYKNRRTGERIKTDGYGRPLTPGYFYPEIREKEKKEPEIDFTVEIDINL